MLVKTVCFDHMYTYPALLFCSCFKPNIAIESSQQESSGTLKSDSVPTRSTDIQNDVPTCINSNEYNNIAQPQ